MPRWGALHVGQAPRSMTFNLQLSLVGTDREEALQRLSQYQQPVMVAENERFNGQTSSRAICGLGFQTEDDRLMFMLEFKDRYPWMTATEQEMRWGFDPTDIDF